ncbi:hypothetical protein BGZ52_002045, partial [Haplosporangium bisporale]
QTTTPSPQSHSHSQSHGLSHPDHDILDNASDHEWTSIRHTISRAKARQEQYYRNQEQRAQEWHFVLGQHQKASASASARNITRKNKDIHSSDEYEEPVASPIISVFTSSDQEDPNDTPIRFETDLEGDRSSHFGFSDLASDDALDAEDQGWSHDDDDAHLSSTSTSKPHRQRYHGQIKLQNCSIYESEMEDVEGMVIDIPSKVGWLQIFEQALTVFNHHALDDMDSALNPIKALAQSPFVDDLDPNATIGVSNGSTTTLTTSVTGVDSSDKDSTSSTSGSKETSSSTSSSSTSQPATGLALPPTPLSGSTSSSITLSSQVQMKHLRQMVSASSLDALQRLQKRQRSDMAYHTTPPLAPSRVSVDPMYVDFMPTVVDSVLSDTTSTSSLGKHTPTRSTSTMTGSDHHPSDRDTNVLATVISTLRRFRDHVKSNLLHPEFDHESNYLSGLGFEGDLGMEWAIGTSSSSNSGEDVTKGEGSPVIVIGNMDTNRNRSKGRFFGRALPSGFSSGASTPTLSTTTTTTPTTTTRAPSRVSSATNMRIGSECGLESLSLRHEDWSNGRGERIHRYSHRYDEGQPSLVD